MIIADENIDQTLIDDLRKKGFNVYSVRKDHPGITDREVVALARDKKAVILTEDKDFGELAFSFNIADCSIVLLRYRKHDYAAIVSHLLQALGDYYNNSDHVFITVTKRKIRIRRM